MDFITIKVLELETRLEFRGFFERREFRSMSLFVDTYKPSHSLGEKDFVLLQVSTK